MALAAQTKEHVLILVSQVKYFCIIMLSYVHHVLVCRFLLGHISHSLTSSHLFQIDFFLLGFVFQLFVELIFVVFAFRLLLLLGLKTFSWLLLLFRRLTQSLLTLSFILHVSRNFWWTASATFLLHLSCCYGSCVSNFVIDNKVQFFHL